MLIDYEFAFYSVMVTSIIVVFWLEALLPLEPDNWDLEHLGRNFIIWLLAFACADLLVGYYLVDIQLFIGQQPFGVFYWLAPPADWVLILLGLILLDLSDYLFHRISHHSRFLWRLHAVHHSDIRLDISTTLRGHPFELIVSNFWKFGIALLLGVPIWVIGFREIFIFPFIFLQHANVKLPARLEKALGYVLITPVIHRLHHSINREEHDSNYGEFLIIWDKLFGSFRIPESLRPEKYGVKNLESDSYQTIDGMLLTPLKIYHHAGLPQITKE